MTRIEGMNSPEARAALERLDQALASGVLRSEDLNGVFEHHPEAVQAIAAGLGKSIADLRQMCASGEMTCDVVIAALANLHPGVDR